MAGKNKCAVSLGSKGGKKGGPARAKALSAPRREAIARQGARALHTKKSKTSK